MSVDWSALGAMLSGIGTIIGAGTVVFAALIGRDTFKQWKRQKQEERRMAAAEQVLVVVYQMKRAIEDARRPLTSIPYDGAFETFHGKARFARKRPIDLVLLLAASNSVVSSLKASQAAFTEAQSMLPLVKALFGDETEALLREISNQNSELTHAANHYSRLLEQRQKQSEAELKQDWETLLRLQNSIWREDGPIRAQVEIAEDRTSLSGDADIQRLERQLLPIIRNG
ncbi:hypothetical protein [Sphingomonas sp. G-3-2-10]|uniref:hypothetical protein n=1 Tax=Sphingomonas sp. G-3-2-10 TaxID=2728838 RepID=UPI001469CAC1|nr:hypothetical protein [Sphingomonas sp. G-3-2-10]NML04284.1 hypothetical protein [Sphingomonas sp. G-3-2-10]